MISTNIRPNKFDAPLVHKLYEFYKLFHIYIKLFPKTEKYSLGQKIENLILTSLEQSILAARAIKQEKTILLNKIDKNVNLLKILIRLAYDTKSIDNKKYIILQEQLQEIGKMIGGWLKSLL